MNSGSLFRRKVARGKHRRFPQKCACFLPAAGTVFVVTLCECDSNTAGQATIRIIFKYTALLLTGRRKWRPSAIHGSQYCSTVLFNERSLPYS
uniref:Secreted protein n=1 Tax=Ascaris lumbricoides TaxID=6252 RepID=A0A0M3I092_ASCLU